MKNGKQKQLIIYQSKSGQIEFRGDFEHDTVWGTQKQIAEIFDVDIRTINEHLKNIYKTAELTKKATIRKFRIVQKEGKRNVKRDVNYYNLDAIISVGYRVNSKQATQFRKWATEILKKHLVDGYTINKKRIVANYDNFMEAVAHVREILPANNKINADEALELINTFANTWFSLDAYDKTTFPKNGISKKQIIFTADELKQALQELKAKLILEKQATDIFGQDKTDQSVNGIIGNVFQSFNKKDLYPTIELKAAHLLYFMVKNHPFIDGNKRSGAFSFVWFLKKARVLRASLTPEALTTLTLLVAESKPKDKDKVIGLILLLLK